MSGFEKVNLGEYRGYVGKPNGEGRTVIILAESEEAAISQICRLANHLSKIEGVSFSASGVEKLENYHVTFTEAAWEALKAS
jgi:hypothetical protein